MEEGSQNAGTSTLRLKVLVPTEVVLEEDVESVVAEGDGGAFGLLPRHADSVSALVPGLLSFRRPGSEVEEHVAVDRGILVKIGREVLVSVRSAVRGERIEELVRLVHSRFLILDDHERTVRTAVAKLESAFLRRFLELK